MCKLGGRDHNATSYSTETRVELLFTALIKAEIITLRAIALKHVSRFAGNEPANGRDHNATSYSTETFIQCPV